MASDEFLRRPRQRLCPAGSGFGQFKRWEWIWTLLKRSRCTVSFPRHDHDKGSVDQSTNTDLDQTVREEGDLIKNDLITLIDD